MRLNVTIPHIQDLKFAVSKLRFVAYAKDEKLIAAYAKKRVDELQHVRVSFKTFSISPEDLLAFTFEASIGEVVGEVSAQAKAAGGEAPDDVAAKSVTAAEGVATE
ncbi:hypothetical protein ACFX19_042979 [Malus domestica]